MAVDFFEKTTTSLRYTKVDFQFTEYNTTSNTRPYVFGVFFKPDGIQNIGRVRGDS